MTATSDRLDEELGRRRLVWLCRAFGEHPSGWLEDYLARREPAAVSYQLRASDETPRELARHLLQRVPIETSTSGVRLAVSERNAELMPPWLEELSDGTRGVGLVAIVARGIPASSTALPELLERVLACGDGFPRWVVSSHESLPECLRVFEALGMLSVLVEGQARIRARLAVPREVAVPREAAEDTVQSLYDQARELSGRDPESALGLAELAWQSFRDRGDAVGERRAWALLLRVAMECSTSADQLWSWLERGLASVDSRAGGNEVTAQVLATSLVACVSFCPNLPERTTHASKAAQLLYALRDPERIRDLVASLIWYHHWLGSFDRLEQLADSSSKLSAVLEDETLRSLAGAAHWLARWHAGERLEALPEVGSSVSRTTNPEALWCDPSALCRSLLLAERAERALLDACMATMWQSHSRPSRLRDACRHYWEGWLRLVSGQEELSHHQLVLAFTAAQDGGAVLFEVLASLGLAAHALASDALETARVHVAHAREVVPLIRSATVELGLAAAEVLLEIHGADTCRELSPDSRLSFGLALERARRQHVRSFGILPFRRQELARVLAAASSAELSLDYVAELSLALRRSSPAL